jgi:hypothetical protein
MKTAVIILSTWFLAAFTASAAAISSGWFLQVSYGGGGTQMVNTTGGATVTPQELLLNNAPCGSVCYDQTSEALVYGNATNDTIHAYAESTDSASPVGNIGDAGQGPISYANFSFDVSDDIHFTSQTLSAGTPVSFLLTETLDSTISATTPGTCSLPIGEGYNPGVEAEMEMFNNQTLLGAVTHDSCGRGSDSMTLSSMLSSTVGGTFEVGANLSLYTTASVLLNGTSTNTGILNASDTGTLTIQVLTPGVGFYSDSGATYSGVPEPSAAVLVLFGAAVGAWRKRAARKDAREESNQPEHEWRRA